MDRQDELLYSRLCEQAARSVIRKDVEFTRFLDPREQKLAQKAAGEEGAQLVLYGAETLERRVCAFDGRYWLDGDQRRLDWPVQPLEISWDSRFASPAHRDILGAVLGLGINRDSTGDIQVGEGRAVLWALDSAAAYITTNLERAGRATVKVKPADTVEEDAPAAEGKMVRDSVQSLRLDAVVAAAFNLSREEAARAVKSGLVRVDYEEETRTDRHLAEGMLISVRGMGRARLLDASARTKRSGRIVLEMERTK